MPYDVIMPKIAESIFEGTITKWLRKEGDKIERDEPLFEISTDKIDTEIPCPYSGYLNKILHKEGETVAVNTVIAVISDSPAAQTAVSPPAAAETAAPAQQAEIKAVKQAPPQTQQATAGRILTTPLVRKMAKDEGVDLALVKGTGPGGRITKEDLESHLRQMREIPKVPAQPLEQQLQPQADVSARRLQTTTPIAGDSQANPFPLVITGEVTEEKMTPMRKKIAEHMVISKRISPHVASLWEANMDTVVAIREREKSYFERVHNTPLTYTAFFVAAAVEALKEFPYMNCSIDGDKLILKKYINIGIAVSLPDGLIVPVIKNAHEKSFVRVCKDISDLAGRARSKRLSPDEVKGGTFTITNPGIYGGLIGIPIINQPEVAIMGIGGIQKRAVVRDNAIAIANMVYLSISFDHRIIDGAYADQFMSKVKATIEDWRLPTK